jgi:hypothetical protein
MTNWWTAVALIAHERHDLAYDRNHTRSVQLASLSQEKDYTFPL